MSSFLRRCFVVAAVFVMSVVSSAQARIDCSAINSRILKRAVHYCVYLPSGYDATQQAYPVLYFLHGLGDNEQTLFNSGGWTLMDDLRKQHRMGDFLIVAPEGWRSFYVNSADGKFRYSDFFLQEFMPHIESKYRIRKGRAARAHQRNFHGRVRRLAIRVRASGTFLSRERAERGFDHRNSQAIGCRRAYGYATDRGARSGFWQAYRRRTLERQ